MAVPWAAFLPLFIVYGVVSGTGYAVDQVRRFNRGGIVKNPNC